MRYCLFLILMAAFGLCLMPHAARGDDTHIDIHIDSRGISEDIIRLKEHAHEMEKEERLRVEEKLKRLSVESLEVGDLYLKKGEFNAAIDYYRQAIYLDGANTAAHEQLIEAARIRDSYERTIGPHYHRAMNYYRQGMTQKAAEELVAAIRKDPDNEAAKIKLNEIESLQQN